MKAILKNLRVFSAAALLAAVLLVSLAACSPAGRAETPAQTSPAARLKVVATTSIVGDVVRQVGGEYIDLDVLLPLGADPHGFEPSPRDIARIAGADLVFANGAGLEEFLQPLIRSAGGDAPVVEVSAGVRLIEGQGGGEHPAEDAHTYDPHVWMDPNNVMIWVENIKNALSENDPGNAAVYAENAAGYRGQLQQLDAWIRGQAESVPAGRRSLVVDHLAYSYFAERYGFTQAAAIIPGFSTLSEPSAQEIALLEKTIREMQIKAIFVGNSINPALAERIAADTGAQIVRLYSGSLSEPGGEADTYLNYMRYNVNAIITALNR